MYILLHIDTFFIAILERDNKKTHENESMGFKIILIEVYYFTSSNSTSCVAPLSLGSGSD